MRRDALYAGAVVLGLALAGIGGAIGYNATWREPAPVIVPPTPAPTPIPAPVAAEPELVIVTDESGRRIEDKAVEQVSAKLAIGTWRVVAIPKPGETGWTRTVVVSGGVVPPTPIPTPTPIPPTPPIPTPVPPIPTPPVPPVPQPGPRQVLVIYESGNTTPALRRIFTGLRAGPESAYMKQQGHTLSILDADDVDENGQPSKMVQAWKPLIAGDSLPVVFIIDGKTNQLIAKESIPPTATAADVLVIVKANGG